MSATCGTLEIVDEQYILPDIPGFSLTPAERRAVYGAAALTSVAGAMYYRNTVGAEDGER